MNTSNHSLANQAQDMTSKAEDIILKYGSPIKPYLPMIARFLLVVTFYEDSLRIVMQWSEQNYFMKNYRGFPSITSELFLSINVLVKLFILILR